MSLIINTPSTHQQSLLVSAENGLKLTAGALTLSMAYSFAKRWWNSSAKVARTEPAPLPPRDIVSLQPTSLVIGEIESQLEKVTMAYSFAQRWWNPSAKVPTPLSPQEIVSLQPTSLVNRLPLSEIESQLEKVAHAVSRHSLKVTKFESNHLSPLSLQWKENIVTGIARGMRYLYIDGEMGKRMASLIMRNLQLGNYDAIASPFCFKDAVLQDLHSIYPDKHLELLLEGNYQPDYDPERSLRTIKKEEYTQQQREYMKAVYADRPDFSKDVESYIIPNTQIGYFKINRFPSPDYPETQPIIKRAMDKVVHAKALVIDLRGNTGGFCETVAFVASYLFNEKHDKQLIDQLYNRSTNQLTSYYAEPAELPQVFGGKKPIYVLTSEETFSGGEELAYVLQSLKRAKVIGQTTGGGAHRVRNLVIDHYLFARIPYEKSISPITGTNWEGVGVKPDRLIPKEADALTVAISELTKSKASSSAGCLRISGLISLIFIGVAATYLRDLPRK